MNWWEQLIVNVILVLATFFLTRRKTDAETAGIRIDNQVKYTDLANGLFDQVLELKEKVDKLGEELRQERAIRLDCQNRLTELERKVNG